VSDGKPLKLIGAAVSTWTAQCVHCTPSDPAKGNKTLWNGMLPLKTNVAIVCGEILVQSIDARPGIVPSILTGITRSIEHIFILLDLLMMKF
jgi:hypothetical protein